MKLLFDFETTSINDNAPTFGVSMVLRSYSDPGHGWVAVKRSLLQSWGLLDKVSSCSYQSNAGKTVYLEEDGDLQLLMDKATSLGIKVEFKGKSTNTPSSIRSYPRFTK